MENELGELIRIPVRDVWRLEDRHFSNWLANNPERLGKAVGLEPELRGREISVGSFSVDILAHDLKRDRKVIIENQLGRTDHDHLGKLITYASGMKASVIIWISPDFREATQGAVSDSPNSAFFLDFYTKLAAELRSAGFNNISRPGAAYWLIVERWANGFHLAAAFSWSRFTAGLYIASSDPIRNLSVFDSLHSRSSEVETALNIQPIVWDRELARVRQNVWTFIDNVDRNDESSLERARKWGVEVLTKFRDVLGPLLAQADRDFTESHRSSNDR